MFGSGQNASIQAFPCPEQASPAPFTAQVCWCRLPPSEACPYRPHCLLCPLPAILPYLALPAAPRMLTPGCPVAPPACAASGASPSLARRAPATATQAARPSPTPPQVRVCCCCWCCHCHCCCCSQLPGYRRSPALNWLRGCARQRQCYMHPSGTHAPSLPHERSRSHPPCLPRLQAATSCLSGRWPPAAWGVPMRSRPTPSAPPGPQPPPSCSWRWRLPG